MSATADYDIVIVGGGSGGLVAAREAVHRGARPLIIQDGPVGGDCTFTGCVPSKVLLAGAARGDSFVRSTGEVTRVIDHIAGTEDADALALEGIDVLDGFARFVSPREVEVDGRRIRCERFVVATGARPSVPPIPGLDGVDLLTNENLFDLERLPASLAVLGGGAIGCEMSQAFARFGSRVTLIEAVDRLLPVEEPEASSVIAGALEADGVSVGAGVAVVAVERLDDGRSRLALADGGSVEVESVLVATGRRPSGTGFGLEEIGVEVDGRGAIVVDDSMATSVDGVWAVGDVVGRMQFTHAAARMGWAAAGNALAGGVRRNRRRFDSTAIPWATFTSPEVGRVGITEAEAADHKGARVAFLPLDRVDRALMTGSEAGFVKLVAAPRRGIGNAGGGRLLGATVVAPTGGELVHEAALAMQTDMFVGRLAQTPHAYPTWSMAVQQAALQFFRSTGGLEARPVA